MAYPLLASNIFYILDMTVPADARLDENRYRTFGQISEATDELRQIWNTEYGVLPNMFGEIQNV